LENYCLRCGRALEDRELFGRVRRACPDCGWIHFRSAPVAAGSILFQEDRLLLIRRKHPPLQDHWSFPCGFQEADESPAQAAEREAREETGLEVRAGDVFGVFFDHNGAKNVVVVVYRGEITGGTLRPGDDAAEVRAFPLRETPENLAFPSSFEVVRRLRAEARLERMRP